MSQISPFIVPAVALRPRFEPNLEALRGFAALVVVLHHAFIHKHVVDPAYAPPTKWLYTFPGHSAVLVFFILSGYVIGLTNQVAITRSTIGPYLRKRLVRLYPIYAISLLLTLPFALHKYAWGTVVGHFFFLQNSAVPLIMENNPLWSLNNELLYYLLFIPLSYFSFRLGWVCVAAGALGVVSAALRMPLLTSYSIGFLFWTCGLWLAQSTHFTPKFSSRRLLLGLLALFLGYQFLDPVARACEVLNERYHLLAYYPGGTAVTLIDVLALPFCFYLFLRFTNHTWRYGTPVIGALLALNALFYAQRVSRFGFFSEQAAHLLIPAGFFFVGLALWAGAHLEKPPTGPVSLPWGMVKLGAISYGIYVVHFPISLAFARVTAFSGTAASFYVRLVLDVLVVVAAGYLLEIKVQPWFKAWLSQPARSLARTPESVPQ